MLPDLLINYWNAARLLSRHLAQMRSIHERNIVSKKGETYQKVIQDGDSSMMMEKCATARLAYAQRVCRENLTFILYYVLPVFLIPRANVVSPFAFPDKRECSVTTRREEIRRKTVAKRKARDKVPAHFRRVDI